MDGVGQLCADLGIEPTDVVMLVLAWHLQAVRMCEFTRAQFVDGLTKLGCGRLPTEQRVMRCAAPGPSHEYGWLR